jgi:membrane protein implicated in regulation of membrane protease activity
LAIGICFLLAIFAIYIVPWWAASTNWQAKHVFFIIFGVMSGSMIAGFIGANNSFKWK